MAFQERVTMVIVYTKLVNVVCRAVTALKPGKEEEEEEEGGWREETRTEVRFL